MSGGYFDYQQYQINHIADAIERVIETNNDSTPNEYGETYGRFYSEETIERFREAVALRRKGAIYAQRIDWLLSDDDGEESFNERLTHELKKHD